MVNDGGIKTGEPLIEGALSTEGIPIARPVLIPVGADPAGGDDPFLLPDYRSRDVWLEIGILTIALVAVELLAGLLLEVAIGSPIDPSDADYDRVHDETVRALQVPMLAIRASLAAGIIFWLVRRRRNKLASVGLRRASVGWDFLIGLLATLAIYGVMGLASIIIQFSFPEAFHQMAENANKLMSLIPRLHPLAFAPFSLMIGAYEELLFRGFLMVRLRRVLGGWTGAVLISTAVFTLLHAMDQVPLALVAVTLLSLVFSVLTIWRRSIVPAIWAHAMFDWSQFMLLYYSAGDAWQ